MFDVGRPEYKTHALQIIPVLSLLPFFVLFVFCVSVCFLSENVFGFHSFIEFGVWELGIEFRSSGDLASFVDVQDPGFLNGLPFS